MSWESDDQVSLDQCADTGQELKRNVKFSYTRDFLLSLSVLDACKKLPSGFDKSILSKFEDAFHSPQDRPRPSGGLPMQNFRRTEYGSSPPFRGDSGTYSRGGQGKWDSRLRDSDSQSDRDSDSGKRFGNQSRQSWQNHEHDGLLGSGSFPKSSGFVSGASPSKFQANDRYQLSRSNAPYQPPRPYKAVPHLRRDGKDSFNDETFGSLECTSEDQAEEERKRRASFELMRKEQHRAFQEKQALVPDKHKKPDLTAWMEDSKDDHKHSGGDPKLDESLVISASESDSSKPLLSSQTPAPRPLVPPGFKSSLLEKPIGSKSVIPPRPTELESSDLDSGLMHAKGNTLLDRTPNSEKIKKFGDQKGMNELQHEIMSTHVPFVRKVGDILNSTSASEDNKRTGMDNDIQPFKASNLSETDEALLNGEIIEHDSEKQRRRSIEAQPTSILAKLFGSSLTVNSSEPAISEHPDSKVEDTWSPGTVQSSKFAHWFHEDENKSADGLSSTRSNNLLSLIGGGEKGGILTSDAKTTNAMAPGFPFQSSEFANRPKTSSLTLPNPGGEQVHCGNKPDPVPVLTCEDLEQSLLSEVSERKLVSETPLQGWTALEAKRDQPKANIDNRASQHLLSLLQKGNELEDLVPPSNMDVGLLDKQHIPDVSSTDTALSNLKERKSENFPNMSKTLTLEALFGPAFMKELQSSVPTNQRSSAGSSRHDILESYGPPVLPIDNGPASSTVDESSALLLSHLQQTEKDKQRHVGFDSLRSQLDSAKLQSERGFTLGGMDRRAGYQLPEDGNPPNQLNRLFTLPGDSSQAEVSFSKRPVGGPEKLGALSAIFKDDRSMIGRQDDQPLTRDFYDMFEPKNPYQNVHAQPPPQFHPPHMNHGRPMFNSSDMHPHINAQMDFPERMIHRDTPPLNHQFSPNMFPPPFHHPDMRPTSFDPPAHHHMPQQMHMPGNIPLPHLLPEFPVGAQRPPHPNNQVFGFRHEPSRFPIGQQQPGFGGLGISPPVGGVGGVGNNHPEALQRLLEMELRSNPKPTHRFPGPLGSLNL